ncbi:MAG TPA: M20 family metallopeptidase [Thermoplasmata archaeon]|nr:M20 family metallopeptidase [Thermoplasmata archaeon]
MIDTALTEVERHLDEDEVVGLARDMIRIPSIFGNEARIAEFIASRLESWGFSPRFVEVPGFGPDVVVDYGDPGLPKVVLSGHMDTVEVMSGWVHDPFRASIEDGFMYGLGSLDMKSGLAAMMVALKAISESGLQDRLHVSFQAVSGEEKDGDGTRTLIRAGEFEGARAIIVGEGFGGLNVVTAGRRGGSYYEIEVRGKSAHGAIPHKGINAVVEASKVVLALDSMEMVRADGVLADDLAPLKESQTVLLMHGGTGSLTVPDRCTMKVVRSTVPGGKTDISDDIRSVIAGLGLQGSAEVTFKSGPKDLYLPHMTSSDSPLVRAVVSSVRQYTGSSPTVVCGVSEADDNLIAQETRVPVICVGPGESGNLARYHQAEEAISIGQLGTAAKVFARTVLDLS